MQVAGSILDKLCAASAGCTDPSAANYSPSATADDGSCTFVFEEAGKEVEISGTLHDYVTSALRSLWGAHQPQWLLLKQEELLFPP